jgi:hypothetical protein
MIALVLGSAAFVAVAILIHDRSPLVAWLCGGFFGLCGLVGLVNLHPRAGYLTLRRDGFEFSSLFRKAFVRWTDVELFMPVRMHGNRYVAWNYVLGFEPQAGIRRVNSTIAGFEAMLPDTYGFEHEALAALMNELRERAVRGA